MEDIATRINTFHFKPYILLSLIAKIKYALTLDEAMEVHW